MNSIWCCGWSGCCFSDAKMEVLLRNINGYGMGMVWICDEYVMDMVWVWYGYGMGMVWVCDGWSGEFSAG